jgi:hypothetical protein
VNEYDPATNGVPLINPVEALSNKPCGSPFAVHVYGAAPPIAFIWYENGSLNIASGNSAVEIDKGGAMTFIVNVRLAVRPALSRAASVIENVPGTVGIPESVPVPPSRINPGTSPLKMAHVYGAVPPVTENVRE